jgi:transposase
MRPLSGRRPPGREARTRGVGPRGGASASACLHAACRAEVPGPIPKAGDALLRRLLVTSAHYVLGPFGPDTELRRFGLRLAERGEAAAKKRAVVAVARKLSVLLHRLWVTGEEYQAIGYGQSAQEAA